MFSIVHFLHLVLKVCSVDAVLILAGRAHHNLELLWKKELLPRDPLNSTLVFMFATDQMFLFSVWLMCGNSLWK
jgi:hypothetical protein